MMRIERFLQKVNEDKLFEINNGHDGTWIAHPGLADYVNEIFKDKFDTFQTNQLDFISDKKLLLNNYCKDVMELVQKNVLD